MSFLVRKFTKSKWPTENHNEIEINDLKADAITSCLRTSKDQLSTWEIDSIDKYTEAVVALASSFDKIQKMDVVIIDKDEVINEGFNIENNKGNTPIERLIDTHKDVSGLTYKKIGTFSKILLDSLGKDDRVKRLTVKKIIKLLQEEIKNGNLDPNLLKPGVREEIEVAS